MKTILNDMSLFIKAFRNQGAIFYFGCAYILFTYLMPQNIYPQLNFLPWLKLTILIGLSLMLVQRHLLFKGTHALVFLLAILALISAYNSFYPQISKQYINIPFIWAVEVLFLSNCVSNLNQFKLLVAILFLFLFKMSLFGAKTWMMNGFGFSGWGIQGPPGFFLNSGEYSLLMAMLAVMSIPFILSLNFKRRYLWLLPVTAMMSVLGASSRGSQLALAIGMIYLFVAYKKLNIKYIIYASILAWLALTILPEEQKARFSSIGEDDTSITRTSYWEAGIKMMEDNPWTGVGVNAFAAYYADYFRTTEKSGYLSNRREVAHNSLIQIGSAIGIPGLIIYVLLHALIFFNSRSKASKIKPTDLKEVNQYVIMLRGGILTYFIGSLFMSVAFYPYIYLLLGLSIALKCTTNSTIKS